MTDIYRLSVPSEWPRVPDTWSHSSLSAIDACPRLWQYRLATWGQTRGIPERTTLSAAMGSLMHEALERLFKAFGALGSPPLGTEAGLVAFQRAKLDGFFEARIRSLREQNLAHPFGPLEEREVLDARALKNRALATFKKSYRPSAGATVNSVAPPYRGDATPKANNRVGGADQLRRLRAQGGLSEVALQIPELNFGGVIDRVQVGKDGGTEILEFKTGTSRASHTRQVHRYGVLWWVATGDVPARLSLVYEDTQQSYDVTVGKLAEWKHTLAEDIGAAIETAAGRPAVARPDPERCRYCPARGRCDEGWAAVREASSARGDLEVDIEGTPTDHAFTGRRADGKKVQVVYESGLKVRFPTEGARRRLRVVGASTSETSNGTVARVAAWSEVFWL